MPNRIHEGRRLMYVGSTRERTAHAFMAGADATPRRGHRQGKDSETDEEVTRETAQSHMAKIAAMLAGG